MGKGPDNELTMVPAANLIQFKIAHMHELLSNRIYNAHC